VDDDRHRERPYALRQECVQLQALAAGAAVFYIAADLLPHAWQRKGDYNGIGMR
jgi:hypothetical protein